MARRARLGIDLRELGGRRTGIGRWTLNALDAGRLLGVDHEITGFTKRGSSPPDIPGVTFHPVAGGLKGDLFGLAVAARRTDIDIFLSPYFKLPFGMECPSIVTLHDLIPLRVFRGLKRRYFGYRLGHAARSAARVAVVSETTRRDALENGIPGEKLILVPNSVCPGFSAHGSPDDVRHLEDFGLAPGSYSLSVIDERPHKNLKGLIEAWSGIDDEVKRGRILAVASGKDIRREGDILFLGPVSDEAMPALYRNALFLVHPAFDEGFGLPPIEAMASGTPVAASSGGAIPEVVGDAADLFDPRSISGMRAVIERLLLDDKRRAVLSEAGLARASQYLLPRPYESLWRAIDGLI